MDNETLNNTEESLEQEKLPDTPENENNESESGLYYQLKQRILEFSEIIILSRKLGNDVQFDELLKADDENVAVNALHLISAMKRWDIRPLELLKSDNQAIQAAAAAHVLKICKDDLNNIDSIAFYLEEELKSDSLSPKTAKSLNDILNDIRYLITIKIAKSEEPDEETINFFNRLYRNADEKSTLRILHDASPNVQFATLQMLMNKKELPLSTISSALILLKNNDDISSAVLQLLKKHPSFPELIIPTLFDFMIQCSQKHFLMALDVIEKYGDEAIPSVLALFNNTHPKAPFVLSAIVQTCPKRFIAKICNLLSIRLQDHVHQNVLSVLYVFSNDDETARQAIENDKDRKSMSEIAAQEAKANQFKPPVSIPYENFHSENLSDEVLAEHASEVSDNDLLDLLNDGRLSTRVNAINLARIQKNKNPLVLDRIKIWLKSTENELIEAAQKAIFELCDDEAYCTFIFLRQFCTSEKAEIANTALDYLQKREHSIDILMQKFLENPAKFESAFTKLLKSSYASILTPRLLDVIDPDAKPVVNHIALSVIFAARFKAEELEPIREKLIKIVYSKSFYNDSINRRLALKLLKTMSFNQKTIDDLKAFVRNHPVSSLEKQIKQILHFFKADIKNDDDEYGDDDEDEM